MYGWVVLLSILITLLLSLWQRVKRLRQLMDEQALQTSPLSLAIQQLLAIAGSIYLSLIMLVSFLKLKMPAVILIFDVAVDPLALSAIGLAIIQPLFLTLFDKIKK